MSFRVNKSHRFLQPQQAVAPQPQQTIADLLKLDDEKDDDGNFDWLKQSTSNTTVSQSQPVQQRPAQINAHRGLVITQNPRAQEDFM